MDTCVVTISSRQKNYFLHDRLLPVMGRGGGGGGVSSRSCIGADTPTVIHIYVAVTAME